MEQSVDDLLREGVAAAKAGQHEHARDLLTRVVAQDERNAVAWLWLSGVVESLEDREICMENVLAVEPDNAAARRGLAAVRRQMASQASAAEGIPKDDFPNVGMESSPSTSTTTVSESPVAARARAPVSPAAAILGQGSAAPQPAPEAELQPAAVLDEDSVALQPVPESRPSATVWDGLGDEYLCPYCAVQTDPDDRRCEACGGDLWIKLRYREERSAGLWTLIAIQLINTFMLAALPAGVLLVGSLLLTAESLPMGRLLEIPAGLTRQMVIVAAVVSSVPFAVSLGVLVALYLRWKPVYYLILINAVLEVFFSIITIAFVDDPIALVGGLVGAGFAVAVLIFVFNLGDDFRSERRRILLRLDPGLGSGTDFLARASFYNKQKMWAMAAIHVRRAAALLPERSDCHMALAVAWARIKRYDSADKALAEARRVAPTDPRIEQLRALLDELRSGGGST
jgi:hypothetical protein